MEPTSLTVTSLEPASSRIRVQTGWLEVCHNSTTTMTQCLLACELAKAGPLSLQAVH
jgi:hypothetical protein